MTQDLSVTTTDIGVIIHRLGSRQPSIRKDAELSLDSLTPDQANRLVRRLRWEPKKTIGRMALWFSLVAWPMVFLPSWLTFGHAGGLSPFWASALFASFLAGYMVLFPLLVARPRLQNTLLYCTTRVNNPALLGPLVTYMRYSSPGAAGVREKITKLFGGRVVTPEQVEQALISSMRSINSEVELDLTGSERSGLTRLLLIAKPELAGELLALLGIIGNSSDLRNVSMLEGGAHAGRDSLAVREAAALCRSTIEARLTQQKIPATLLRASQSSAPVNELLRTTPVAAPIEEQVMLRSSDNSE